MAYDHQEQEQLDSFKAFWSQYGNIIIWVLILALGSYAGWYAVRDEAFYGEDELTTTPSGKKLAPTGAECEWVEEPSYFFRLSAFQDQLEQLSIRCTLDKLIARGYPDELRDMQADPAFAMLRRRRSCTSAQGRSMTPMLPRRGST